MLSSSSLSIAYVIALSVVLGVVVIYYRRSVLRTADFLANILDSTSQPFFTVVFMALCVAGVVFAGWIGPQYLHEFLNVSPELWPVRIAGGIGGVLGLFIAYLLLPRLLLLAGYLLLGYVASIVIAVIFKFVNEVLLQ